MAKPKTKQFKQEICRQMALGIPIQKILNPDPPLIRQLDLDGEITLVPDPDFVPPEMPDWNMVVEWLKNDPVFQVDFEVARKYGATYLADEMLGLVKMLRDNPKNAPAVKAAMEVLKWQSAMRDPKFNERLVIEQKTDGPMDPEKVRTEMEAIKKELKLVKS